MILELATPPAAMSETQARAFIESAGRLLWPSDWRAHFEDRFGISNRRLRRMLAGSEPVPAGLLTDVEFALRDHGQALDRLLETIP